MTYPNFLIRHFLSKIGLKKNNKNNNKNNKNNKNKNNPLNIEYQRSVPLPADINETIVHAHDGDISRQLQIISGVARGKEGGMSLPRQNKNAHACAHKINIKTAHMLYNSTAIQKSFIYAHL